MVIAIANQKGGTGKTTTAVNLASALAERGRRVLIVDLDPEAGASACLGSSGRSPSVAEVLAGECDLSSAVVSAFGVDIVPSSRLLTEVAGALRADVGDQYRLAEALAVEHLAYHWVILDTEPSLRLLTASALVAADSVLIPVPTEPASLHGVAELLRTVGLVQARLNRDLRVLGLVAVRYEGHLRDAREVRGALESYGFPVLQTVIRKRVAVSRAAGLGQPVTVSAPRSDGAQDYRALSEEVERVATRAVTPDG